MKSSLLFLLVPAAMLAACNRADTPEASDMREVPMSAPSPGAEPGEFRDPAPPLDQSDTTLDQNSTTIDQNGNGVVNPSAGTDDASPTRTDIEGTNTTRPDGGSADDARRDQ